MDLSMLEHLSDEALRAEAERRGVRVDPHDRAALIEGIRRAAAAPPRANTLPAPKPRAEVPAPKPSTLGAARSLLGRVVSFARGAIGREPTPPPGPPAPSEPEEPIRTRTMAELLVSQGQPARALAILRELAADHPTDRDLQARCDELAREVAATRLATEARTRLSNAGAPFVALLRDEDTRAAVWSVDDAGLARARAVLGEDGALTLRVVTVRPSVERTVERARRDAPVAPSGHEVLDAAPDARCIVSVGLLAGESFVSIAHASDVGAA